VAIEPEPEHFATLTANINLNGLSDRATLFHAAVGAQHGSRVNLAHPAAHNRGLIHVAENGQHCSAEVVALDRLPLPQSGKIAVKIDVEGYELEVLRGARDFFSANFGYAQIEALGQNSNIVRARMKETGWDLVDTHGPNFMFERHV
jgi:FkbM family methyltransferase